MLYVWDSTYGSTLQQASGRGGTFAISEPFVITVGSSSSPGSLYGMGSFSILGPVPEPGTVALFSLGGALLVGGAMQRARRGA